MKTFNEQYEQQIWKLVLDNCDNETRTDGEEVFVVKDVNKLIVDIMNFYDKKNKS